MDPSVPGTLKVRATVRNTAAFPQPYPLLKLVLENRWGEEVRARAFQPSEYLEGAQKSPRPGRLEANDLANAVTPSRIPARTLKGFVSMSACHVTAMSCAPITEDERNRE